MKRCAHSAARPACGRRSESACIFMLGCCLKPGTVLICLLQVEWGCNDEFGKAWAFGRCNLAAAYTNQSAPDVCHHSAADLSDMSIRLGS